MLWGTQRGISSQLERHQYLVSRIRSKKSPRACTNDAGGQEEVILPQTTAYDTRTRLHFMALAANDTLT